MPALLRSSRSARPPRLRLQTCTSPTEICRLMAREPLMSPCHRLFFGDNQFTGNRITVNVTSSRFCGSRCHAAIGRSGFDGSFDHVEDGSTCLDLVATD